MIHCYKLGGYNIVLDVFSGSIHVVDEIAYDMIENFEKKDKDTLLNDLYKTYQSENITFSDLEECFDQIIELKEQRKLFTEDTFEPMATTLKGKTSGVVKALCLHIAHSCNLCCSYCFAGQGKYKGDSALMSFETGKRALDFLVENSKGRRNLEVDFFGGEPLLNFDVVKKLVEYARKIEKEAGKNFRFTLTTNGVLIDDDVIDFANREMSNVVLSLDGRKEIHDHFRVDYAGNGSWEKIVPKFQKMVESRGGKNYYMRGTFTHQNPDFVNDIEKMLELGFTELSMEPVVCAPGDPYALTEEDLPIVLEQYELLAQKMKERREKGSPFTFYHYMIDLKSGPCIYKRVSGCGSGTEYMAVTPSGDLYPCHQFVGNDKFLLGNVWDGVKNKKVQDEFLACNVYTRPECKNCWAKLYCSGGCAANAFNATGSINGVYEYGCKLFRKRMECAIMLEISKELGE